MTKLIVAIVLAGAVTVFAPAWFDVICLVSLALLGAVALSPDYFPRTKAKTK